MSVDLSKQLPDHIAVMSKDVDETIKNVETVFGKLEWNVFEDVYFPQECMQVGTWFHLKCASAHIYPGMEIELMQPLDCDENNMFYQMMLKDGPRVHHLGYRFKTEEDRQECIKRMVEGGYKVLQSTERVPGHGTTFLQAPDGSMLFDIKC